MKTYKSSDLTHKRAEVLKEAKANGVIIQQLETNGEVRQEFVIIEKSASAIWDLYQDSEQGDFISEAKKLMNNKECKSTMVKCDVCFDGCTKCDGKGFKVIYEENKNDAKSY